MISSASFPKRRSVPYVMLSPFLYFQGFEEGDSKLLSIALLLCLLILLLFKSATSDIESVLIF